MHTSSYYPINNNVMFINPQGSESRYFYLNSNFEQMYDNLLINLNQLNDNSGGGTFLDVSKVDDSDFNIDGLIFDGTYTESGSSYVSFTFDDFVHGWEGFIDFNANLDFLGNDVYDFPSIYLKGDTVNPQVVSLDRLDFDSIPEGYNVTNSGYPGYPGFNSEKHYFHITFSEDVSGTYATSNYWVSNGYKIDTVYVPNSGMPGMYMSSDEILVQVSEVTPGSTILDPTLGLNSRLKAMDIQSLTGRPANTDTYSSTYAPMPGGMEPSPGGAENWYRMELSHDVSKYAFLMQSGTGTDTNFQFSSTAFWISTNSMMPPYPQLREIAFQENVDQVGEFFFRTDIPINTDTVSVNFNAATSYITDTAGNYFSNSEPSSGDDNDLVLIDSTTVPSDGTVATMIDSPASGGFDTLRVELAGDVEVDATTGYVDHRYNGDDWDTYKFSGDFSRYEIDADAVIFWGNNGISDVVALYEFGDNLIQLGSSIDGDIVTDVIDYSAISDGIYVDLSDANENQPYVEVSVNVPNHTGPVDTLRGAEGVVGGSGNDNITGNHADNILVGGYGDDILQGGTGKDILLGGNGLDILVGGKGQDILIDFDGALMTGGEDDRDDDSSAPKDIFVVRSGSTIEDYTTTKSGAGLAGRAIGNINDIIVFNVGLSELAVQFGTIELSSSVMNEFFRNITINVSNSDNDAYWEITATSYIGNGDDRISFDLGDVEVIAQVDDGQNLTVVPLNDDNYFNDASTGDIVSEKIDLLVLNHLLPEITSSPNGYEPSPSEIASFLNGYESPLSEIANFLNGYESINLAFALEATRDGVVRSNGEILMVGDFSKEERIFNPGNVSEIIFGSRGKDTYEFLVQDFSTTASSDTPQFVGNDTIRDTGGLDNVLFSGLDLDSIAQLNFEAVKVGRERGNFSLKTNYSQTENGIVNEGSFTWTGHFREGFDMQLEKITLGDDELFLAQNVFKYNNFGDILSDTPIQQAIEGVDTIMVGGSGRAGASNVFKLKSNGGDSIEQTDLFIWGIDRFNDVIDLSDFISEIDIKAREVQTSNPPGMNKKFEVNLDDDVNTFELAIHFMGAFTADSATLEEMIVARANT
jgi:hypothetical protein